jgi:hypothetical protein
MCLPQGSGKTIGCRRNRFQLQARDDKAKFEKTAEQVRDEWKAQIPSKESLFHPAK